MPLTPNLFRDIRLVHFMTFCFVSLEYDTPLAFAFSLRTKLRWKRLYAFTLYNIASQPTDFSQRLAFTIEPHYDDVGV